jgi:hypothetical protein
LPAGCARAVRGGRTKRADAEAFLTRLGAVPVNLSVDINPAGYWFDRAMKLGCQVVDSAYLAMALDLRAPIATSTAAWPPPRDRTRRSSISRPDGSKRLAACPKAMPCLRRFAAAFAASH